MRGVEVHLPPAPPAPEDQPWLDELRQYVGREVGQWLEDELHGGAPLQPGKQELSEAVGRRRPVLVSERAADRLLDPAEPLAEVFVNEARSLLMLGAPGAGKSVMLRQLARDLLARAEADPHEPVPVLLNLAGWTDDGRTFLDWLASSDGLRRSYRSYTETDLKTWLRDRRLCLLLDGLDEVHPEHRAACVAAINDFAAGAGGGSPGGLVVCSRLGSYQELALGGAHLMLGAAIYLQPLTEEQVRRYLAAGGPPLDGLRAAWNEDPSVRELAQNPLMLSTMSLAFERLGRLRGENRIARLLDAFVERVFERASERFGRQEEASALPLDPDGPALPYDQAQTLRRLGWLADRLDGRATFYLEELQPSWLPYGRPRLVYTVLSRCAGGILLGLATSILLLAALGLSGSLFGGVAEAAATAGIVLALSVAGALAASVFAVRRFAAAPDGRAEGQSAPGYRLWPLTLAALLTGMALLGGLLFSAGGPAGAKYGILFGVLWGAVTAVVFEPSAGWRTVARDIRLVEPLRWSWQSAGRAARRGLLVGALVGAVAGGLWSWVWGTSGIGVVLAGVAAVGVGAVAAAVGGALGGLRQGSLAAEPRLNLGFRLSLRNAAFAGSVTALAAAVVFLLLGLIVSALLSNPTGSAATALLSAASALWWSLGGGLLCGLLAALRYGGLNAVYHLTLRMLLARAGHLPFAAAAFLDFTADLALTRRAGGGYAFANRFLAAHFAAGGSSQPDLVADAEQSKALPSEEDEPLVSGQG
ncbi:MAG: hypothetical protein AAGI91_00385 [Bacteroidota bacterium]